MVLRIRKNDLSRQIVAQFCNRSLVSKVIRRVRVESSIGEIRICEVRFLPLINLVSPLVTQIDILESQECFAQIENSRTEKE